YKASKTAVTMIDMRRIFYEAIISTVNSIIATRHDYVPNTLWIFKLSFAAIILLCNLSYLLTAQAPPVRWSRSNLSVSLIPGQTLSETIILTPSVPLTSVDIVVTPSLSPFVSLTPSHVVSLSPDIPSTVVLTFSIPLAAMTPSIYDGVVQ